MADELETPVDTTATPIDTSGTPAATPTTTPDGTTTADITQPADGTQTAPDFDKLFDDEIPPVADPAAATVPPEFAEVMAISPYVKDAQQLQGAVHLADQVLKVQNGEGHIGQLLNNFREQNSQAFENMAVTQLRPYVERLFEGKLYSKDEIAQLVANGGVQKTPDQERLDAIEARDNQRQQAYQAQQVEQQIRQAQGVALTAADTALKGTWLEGKGKDLLAQIGQHMGMNEEQATKALLSGNTAIVDKAVKAMMAQKEAEGKAYAKWKIAESKKLKTALPASPGNPRSGEPALEAMTRDQRIQYLQSN